MHTTFKNYILTIITLSLLMGLSLSITAQTSWIVDQTGDDVNTVGTLRHSIANAMAGDSIAFDAGIDGDTIKLGGEIFIDKELHLIGNGTDKTIIDGSLGTDFRLFDINGTFDFTMEGITFENGGDKDNFYGGAIIVSTAKLVLRDCHFINNAGLAGGAIVARENATMDIQRCLFRDNESTNDGGAIASFDGTHRIANSIFYDNEATTNGGAIALGAGTWDIFNCNMYRNTATLEGGGIHGNNTLDSLYNNIIYDNFGQETFSDVFLNVAPSSAFSNLLFTFANSQIVVDQDGNIDEPPNFVFLGTPLDLHVSTGSPCIDGGTAYSAVSTLDIEGAPRMRGIVDIGAYEFCNSSATLTVSNNNDDGFGSLRHAANLACAGDTITFDHPMMGVGNIALQSSIVLDKNLVFLGIDSAATIIDGAAGDFSLFDIRGETNIEIRDMSFVNGGGTTTDNDGGAINTYDSNCQEPKSLKIVACGFRNNIAAGDDFFGGAIMSFYCRTSIANSAFVGNLVNEECGGAIHHQEGSNGIILDIVNSIFIDNEAVACGGAISIKGDKGVFINCTFSGNQQTDAGNTNPLGGGAISLFDNAELDINNCIFTRNNVASDSGPNISLESGTITANNNLLDDYADAGFTAGTDGNIEGGPLFVDEATGDYTLQACSPAVDAGDQGLLPMDDLDVDGDGQTNVTIPIDYLGMMRVKGSQVDMGAYEYSGTQTCTEIDCGTQSTDNYCYGNNDDTGWLYHASNGSSKLRLEFTTGTIESCCDEIFIYDGQDETAPILFDGANGGNLSGLTIFTTQPYLYFKVDSDGSLSCDEGDKSPWNWTVDCIDCTQASATATVINYTLAVCGPGATYDVDVNVTSLSTDDYNITNNVTNQVFTDIANGKYTIKDIPQGTPVVVTIQNQQGALCNLILEELFAACIPTNDECDDAIQLDINPLGTCPQNQVVGTTIGATSDGTTNCDNTEPNNGVWFSFITASNQTSIFYQNISISGFHKIAIFEGCDGSEVHCSSSDQTIVSGLTGDTEYRVLIWSDAIGSAGDFNICLSEAPPPPSNDLCVDAIPLFINPNGTCPQNQVMGTTLGATDDGHFSCDDSGENNGIWFSFMTGANQTSILYDKLSIVGTHTIAIFEGCGGAVKFCSFFNQDIIAGLTPNTEYTLLIWSTSGFEGDFTICLSDPIACPEYQDLIGDFTGTGIYTSRNASSVGGIDKGKIISDQLVKSTATLDYSAGKEITLNPGFEVEQQAIFHAYIDGCFTNELLMPTDMVIGGQVIDGNFEKGVKGFDSGVNNWPGSESPEKAIDGFGQKYLNFGELNTGFIVTPSTAHSQVYGLKLWTANHIPERDPASYEIYGINSNSFGMSTPMTSFTMISSGSLSLPASRSPSGNEALDDANSFEVNFTPSTNYTSYLVVFPTVKDATSANSMQIGEVQILAR